MDAHRLVNSTTPSIHDLRRSFSCFDFVDENFQGLRSARRLFSLARSSDATTLVVEDIEPRGVIADEIAEISQRHSDYIPGEVHRLSFWRKAFKTAQGLDSAGQHDLVGYAILKRDILPSGPPRDEWHVFEAVFPKYDHRHNCVPCPKSYAVAAGHNRFVVQGLMYCQQNAVNKACAQVALRSLLSRVVTDGDIAYSRINEIAACVSGGFDSAQGLSPQQMRAILDDYGVAYDDIDYEEEEKHNPDIRRDVPFQSFLYGGIEAGCGGLLGFSPDVLSAGMASSPVFARSQCFLFR